MVENSQNWLSPKSANLPSKRTGPRAISLNNDIFITGGALKSKSSEIYSDILFFDKKTKKWVKTGDLNQPRYGHALAVLPFNEVKPYCH